MAGSRPVAVRGHKSARRVTDPMAGREAAGEDCKEKETYLEIVHHTL